MHGFEGLRRHSDLRMVQVHRTSVLGPSNAIPVSHAHEEIITFAVVMSCVMAYPRFVPF